tara:strand:+ start:1131 stop:2528 length:1398 start_codon:yes stop_codon:yes gene_type:complete
MAFNVTEIIGVLADVDNEGSSEEINLISATGIAPDSHFKVHFSENVSSNSVLSYAVTLFRTMPDGGNSSPVDINLLQQTESSIIVTPASTLIPNATYSIYIPKSKYGIRNNEGVALQSSFTCGWTIGTTYLGEEAAEEAVGSEEDVTVPEVEPIPEELFLVASSPSDESILQHGLGYLTAKFDGRLPEGVTLSITTRHPLGFSVPQETLWGQNVEDVLYSLAADEITVTSKTDSLAPDALIVNTTLDSVTSENQVLVVAEDDGEYTLDFDLNRIFDITFKIPGNSEEPVISFMGLLYPFYAALPEVQVDIGPFVSQYEDYTLTLTIFRHSITAKQIWTANNTLAAGEVPLRLTEYVMARTKKDILSTYFTDPSGVGSGSMALGDLRMSGRNYLKYLQDIVSTLDLKIVALENAIKRGDRSNSPYTDYQHMSLPTQSTSVAVNPSTDYEWENDNISRGLEDKTTGG